MSANAGVLRSRARLVAEGHRLGPVEGREAQPWQAVFKKCHTLKSAESIKRTALYIARARSKDAPGQADVYDEAGRFIPASAEGVHAYLKDQWSLIPDSRNISGAAKKLTRGEREVLSLNERLGRNQAVHLVWSADGAQEPPDMLTQMRVEETSLAALDEMVTRPCGCCVFWGVHAGLPHEDSAAHNTHVHMLIELDGQNRRLVVDQDFFDGFKLALERHGRAVGLNIVAERREDRPDLRQRIARGEEPLRPGRQRRHLSGKLQDRAPGWWEIHGARAEARTRRLNEMKAHARKDGGRGRLAAMLEKPPGGFRLFKRRREPRLPKAAAGLRHAIEGSFHDPSSAAGAYWDLAGYGAHLNAKGCWVFPNKKLADWYMLRRPEVFGEIKGKALAHPLTPGVIAALRKTLDDVETPARPRPLTSSDKGRAVPVPPQEQRGSVADAVDAAHSLQSLSWDVAEKLKDPRRAKLIARQSQIVLDEARRAAAARAPKTTWGKEREAVSPQVSRTRSRSGRGRGTSW